MKKVLALLLPLALMIPTVSCSNKSNPSMPESSVDSQAPTKDSPPDDYVDSASTGTNYTKGYIRDNVYYNDYANIKIKVPETMISTIGGALAESKSMFVAGLSDDADISRESARIWDAQFANPQENVAINFINTKLAFPNLTEVTEQDVLTAYKDYINNSLVASGGEAKWVEGQKETFGNAEYIGNIAYYGSDTNYEALFMRKLDDNLICWLHFASNSPDRNIEYYKTLFE